MDGYTFIKHSALVRWGCHNKMLQTLGGLNNRNVLLPVLEAGESKIKADLVSDENSLPGL